jgi:hypothetical protein
MNSLFEVLFSQIEEHNIIKSGLSIAVKHRIEYLEDVEQKTKAFVYADGRHDPRTLYLELRRCFLDDK